VKRTTYSEAVLLLDKLLDASRRQAAKRTNTPVEHSYAFDSGVLMSHLAISLTEYPELAADIERAVAFATKEAA